MGDIIQKVTEYVTKIVPNTSTATLVGLIAVIVLSLLYCFFGYKLLRIHISFLMCLIGASIGFVVGVMLNLDTKFLIALVVVLAILLAVAGYFLYKVGLFIMVSLLVGCSLYAYLSDVITMNYVIFICIAVGVFFGIVACFFTRPVVIIMTAISGGLSVSNTLIDNFLTQVAMLNTPRTTEYIVLGLAAILAIFGIIFQFRTTENYEARRTRKRN